MAQLAIKGHPTRGKEVIQLLETLGGINSNNLKAISKSYFYYIKDAIINIEIAFTEDFKIYTLEEFEEKFPYKVGNKVTNEYRLPMIIFDIYWDSDFNVIKYNVRFLDDDKTVRTGLTAEDLQPYKEENYCQVIGNDTSSNGVNTSASSIDEEIMEEDKGNVSDGYHTFNELYEYRLLYNASLFNELAKQGLYDVHKSRLHSNGEIPFGDSNWFIVMAELPTGQISNHYEMKDWDLFQIPEKAKANVWDGHSPQDVANRLREFLTPKSIYPKDYEECCDVIGISRHDVEIDLPHPYQQKMFNLFKLHICRDAYWKIAGEQLGLDKPWKPDWNDCAQHKFGLYTLENEIRCINLQVLKNIILVFPTEEMRDDFYENFKGLINECKELL